MTIPDPTDTPFPTLASALARSRAVVKGEINVCAVAVVDSYDASEGTVTCTVIVPRFVAQGDGTLTTERLPTLGPVPVLFPGAGGVRLTWPINPGDLGVLHVRDRSHDEVDAGSTNPQTSEVRSTRRFDWDDALFCPTYVPPDEGLASDETATDGLTINLDAAQKVYIGNATANEALAMASKVKRELDAIDQYSKSHIHTQGSYTAPSGGGPVTGTSGTATSSYSANAVDSARIFTDDDPA